MEVSENTKTEKVPPVILINPGSLNNAICRKLQNKKMQYLKANMIREGVAITPSIAQDYRSLTKFLNESKREYHTYSLPEDKPSRAVNKDVPTNIKTDDVTKDKENQELKAISVHRMIRVKVENQRQPRGEPQFYISQPFGHT